MRTWMPSALSAFSVVFFMLAIPNFGAMPAIRPAASPFQNVLDSTRLHLNLRDLQKFHKESASQFIPESRTAQPTGAIGQASMVREMMRRVEQTADLLEKGSRVTGSDKGTLFVAPFISGPAVGAGLRVVY